MEQMMRIAQLMEVRNQPSPLPLIYFSVEKKTPDISWSQPPTNSKNIKYTQLTFQLHVQEMAIKNPTRRVYQFIIIKEKIRMATIVNFMISSRYSVNCQMQDTEVFASTNTKLFSTPSPCLLPGPRNSEEADAGMAVPMEQNMSGRHQDQDLVWSEILGDPNLTREQFSQIVPEYDSWIESPSMQDRRKICCIWCTLLRVKQARPCQTSKSILWNFFDT